jgi:hypothetical protein
MKLTYLTPDPNNADKGTLGAKAAVACSLANCSAGRSIVVDRNGA